MPDRTDSASTRTCAGVARLVRRLRLADEIAPLVETGECVYFEVLGFWSREAVWRRVELVERALPQRILFAVSAHLRASEAAVGDQLPGALYVYKRVMSARAVLERIEMLSKRSPSTNRSGVPLQ